MQQRQTVSYSLPQETLPVIKMKMLNWLRSFSIFSYLDNNQYNHTPNRFELIVAAGMSRSRQGVPVVDGDWWFGHMNYDYKNALIPGLQSRHVPLTGFTDVFFYCPQIVAYIPFGQQELIISTLDQDPQLVLKSILGQSITFGTVTQPLTWHYAFSQEDYMLRVGAIREHIAAGDCYELNLCGAAHVFPSSFDAYDAFFRLNQLNPAPFAAFYRNEGSFLISASPERFLYTSGQRIVAQPIKGTARRGANRREDEEIIKDLRENEKERAENVMIVDLMRNDLAQCCTVGSIHVPELFGVYTFPQVHQLISTIEGGLIKDCNLDHIIKVTFPMGSMTGAPKRIVMELIDRYEHARRELYSGSVGYMTPEGDVDFNVVIRSLIYYEASNYLTYQTGGAITFDSQPEAEWKELRLKARAMEQLFL